MHWGVAKASRCTATCKDLACYLHSSDQLTLIRSNQAHLHLRAAVLNLQMYGVKWAVADKKVGFDGELAKALHADAIVPDVQGGVPYMEHKDVSLNMVKRGAARIKVGKVKMQGKCHAYFVENASPRLVEAIRYSVPRANGWLVRLCISVKGLPTMRLKARHACRHWRV